MFLQGVVWDATSEETAYDDDDDSNMPGGLAVAWVEGFCAWQAQVGWIDNGLFAYYNGRYAEEVARFNTINGMPNVPLSALNDRAAG